jgi:hypothetical protein
MSYHASQNMGEYDFDLHYAAIIDKDKGGSPIPSRLCKNSWYIHLLPDTRINPLRKNADRYLAAIERPVSRNSGGQRMIVRAWGPYYQDVDVMSGSVAAWIKPRNILMSVPGTGGAVGVSTVFEAAQREAFQADNRQKLGAAGISERHLAVYAYTTTLAWVPMSDFEPISVIPTSLQRSRTYGYSARVLRITNMFSGAPVLPRRGRTENSFLALLDSGRLG